MTRRDKVGLGVLIALFVFLIVTLVYTFRPFGNASRSPENSVFVEQRLINLHKGK